MSEHLQKMVGVVLQTIPFKDYDRIVTLFSPLGILKMFVKIRKKESLPFAALTSPLTEGEWHFTASRTGLHRFVEGSILSQHLELRQEFERLMAAESLVLALMRSQWQEKPAPKLYQLFRQLLIYLPQSSAPKKWVTLFFIKILCHEGLLEVSPPQNTYRYGGEHYPLQSAPSGSIPFSDEDEHLLTSLVSSRSFAQIETFLIPEEFQKKVELLFKQAF